MSRFGDDQRSTVDLVLFEVGVETDDSAGPNGHGQGKVAHVPLVAIAGTTSRPRLHDDQFRVQVVAEEPLEVDVNIETI